MEIKCETCGKGFSARLNSRYCSVTCRNESYKKRADCICRQCGNNFEVKWHKRNTAKYCSRLCQRLASRKKTEIKCEYCGATFEATPYQITHGRKYCSRDCVNAAALAQVDCFCKICGKSFAATPAQIARGEGQYCSYECSGMANRTRREGLCKQCGKSFTTYDSLTTKGHGVYCSRECANIARTGAGSPLWRGGEYYTVGLTWKCQRILAYERDSGICQHCGLTEKQAKRKYGERNSVHHIVKRRTFREQGRNIDESNVLTNLITLCKSCHKKAELARIALQPKLL